MYQIDFHKPLHIHFIGIGGISMSGLAEILLEENFLHSSDPSGQPGICLCKRKRAPNAHTCGTSRPDHA